MLQYLVILLDDTSTSYCHYCNSRLERRLISLDDLKAGIIFAMKENLTIQFVYPDYELPQTYKDAIRSIDHSDIVSSVCKDEALRSKADVLVCQDIDALQSNPFIEGAIYLLRITKAALFGRYSVLGEILRGVTRLNIAITDVCDFTDEDFKTYQEVLAELSDAVERCYKAGLLPQFNLLTDRIMLDKMNNCNAGVENITLAPDGRFYVCPAFYLADEDEDFGLGKSKFSIGSLEQGIDIRNQQLYRLDYAPLCRICDAYQCKRCVWLNRRTTYEVNTPSHEQCVTAHLERNASRSLLYRFRNHGSFLPGKEIEEITYLDPFDIKEK